MMAIQTAITKQSLQSDTPRDRSTVLEDVIRHFAGVTGRSPDEVRCELIDMGGNMVITDKEAKAIFAYLEAQYHRDEFFSATDLCPSPVDSSGKSSGKVHKKGGGCVDPAKDTSFVDLVNIIAAKFGV